MADDSADRAPVALLVVIALATVAVVGGSAVAADGPTLTVEPADSDAVVTDGAQPRVAITTDADAVRWTVHDVRGRQVAAGRTAVDGGQTIAPALDGVGHYTVRVRTIGPDRSTARTTLAVLPATDAPEDRFFGMSTQFDAGWDQDLMAAMTAAGVASVREDAAWTQIERTRGQYRFDAIDSDLQALRDRGLDRLLVLGYGNALYGPPEAGYFTIPSTEQYRRAYASYAAATAGEYPDATVEVWNEPNLDTFAAAPTGTDPAAYAALVAATAPAVHERRANATVLAGAASANYSGETARPIDEQWWRGFFAAGGSARADALSIHLYRDEPRGFGTDLETVRSMAREDGGQAPPIWVTELGWPASPTAPGGDQEIDQARHLVQSHARLRAAGVERLYWYTLRDASLDGQLPSTTDAGAMHGLIRAPDNPRGRTPRPGLVAYATTARKLAGTTHVGTRSTPVQSEVFADGEERTRVLWAAERTDVTVRTDRPVVVTTPDGDRTRLHPHDGAVYLTVGPDPLFLDGRVEGIERGAPVSATGRVTADAAPTVRVATTGLGGPTTHRVADASATVTSGAATLSPAAHAARAGTAVDVVSVGGDPVARLTTPIGAPTARLGDPARITGLTVETANPGAGWFSEANDVGTRHSGFEATERAGRQCWQSDLAAGPPGTALHLDVPRGHLAALDRVPVTIAYYDGRGEIGLQYDGPADGADWGGSVSLDGTDRWRTHTFDIEMASLGDGLGAGHDLRVVFDGGTSDACLGAVAVGSTAEPLAASATGDGTATTATTTTPVERPASETTAEATGTDARPTTSEGPGVGPLLAVIVVLASGRWQLKSGRR